jgi:hypothetical protein
MDHQNNTDAACVAWARVLLAAAAIGVERLQSAANAANLASCRLATLRGMLARLEGRGGSREPEAGEAAVVDAATICRAAKVLLRYISSRQWPADRFVANGGRRGRSPARTGNPDGAGKTTLVNTPSEESHVFPEWSEA